MYREVMSYATLAGYLPFDKDDAVGAETNGATRFISAV